MLNLDFNNLLSYTDWERQKWQEWFAKNGDQTLGIGVGAHADKRFSTVGDVIKHIFSAEKRYVERLSGKTLTDTSLLPSNSTAALFEMGDQSRKDLRRFVETFPEDQWDVPQEFKLLNKSLVATPRKIIIHVVLHEIRHWAQIATLFRLNGLPCEFHDFLFSPVLGELKREQGRETA